MSSKKDNSIKIIEDKVLNLHEADDFGHVHIVSILQEMIDEWSGKVDASDLTIGLLGGWGTGKSSIGDSLERNYLKNKKVKVITFDVWKHEAGSFRREFLTTVSQQLRVKNHDVERMYLRKTETVPTGEIVLNKFLPFYTLIVFLALLVAYLVSYVPGGLSPAEVLFLYKRWIITLVAGTSFFAFLTPSALDFFGKYFEQKKVTYSKDPVKGIEEFSSIYKDVIESSQHGYDRIVIIIDNLDRVSDEKAVELLTAIKTYVCHKKVAFIVQCDEDAVIRHLRNYYSYEPKEHKIIDEFLRKFFNVNLRIPPIYSDDLEDFARKALNKSNVPGSNSLISVIAQAHKDNPRKIIQFVNSLQTAYKLALARENSPTPALQPKGVVSGNIAMLAKVLIFQRDFRDLFDELKHHPHYWVNLQEHIVSSGKVPNKYFSELLKDAELYTFLKTTESVLTSDIEPFIYLKTPNGATSISGSTQMLEALSEEDLDTFAKIFSVVEANQKDNFERMLLSKLDKTVNDSIVRNSIHSYIAYAKSHKLQMHHTQTQRFVDLILNESKFGGLELFELKNADYLLANGLNSIHRQRLFDGLIDLLSQVFEGNNSDVDSRIEIPDYKLELTKYLTILLSEDKDAEAIKRLKETLKNLTLYEEIESLENMKGLFELPQQVQDALITSISLNDFSPQEDEALRVQRKIALTENTSRNKKAILTQFISLGDNASSVTKKEVLENILTTIKRFVNECDQQYAGLVHQLAAEWTQIYNRNESKEKVLIIDFLLALYARLYTYKTELDGEMKTIIDNQLKTVPIEEVVEFLKHIPSTDKDILLDTHMNILRERVTREEGALLKLIEAGLVNREVAETLACRKIVDTDNCLDVVQWLQTRENYFDANKVANASFSRMKHHVQNRHDLVIELANLIAHTKQDGDDLRTPAFNAVKDRVRNPNAEIQQTGITLLDIFTDCGLLDKGAITELVGDHITFMGQQSEPQRWSLVTKKYFLLARKYKMTDTEIQIAEQVFDFFSRHRSVVSLNALVDLIIETKPRYKKHEKIYQGLLNIMNSAPPDQKRTLQGRIDEIFTLKEINLPDDYKEELKAVL